MTATEQFYELQIFNSPSWRVVKSGLDRRFLGAAIDECRAGNPEALRIVHRVIRQPQMFSGDYVNYLWRSERGDSPPEDMPAITDVADLNWKTRQDIDNPLCFYLLRHHFAVFLRSRFITVFDILYDYRIADELQKSWQILQAGLQPIASFQAAVTGNDVPVQVRELSRFFDAMLAQTMQAAHSNPPMPIAKGGLGDVVAEIQKTYPAPEHQAQIMSRLCTTIPHSRDWGERFCQLMSLLSEQPTPAERHYLDRYLAEFVQVDGVVIEGGAPQRNITQQVGLIRDWVNGEKLEGKPEHADAWRRYNDLARTGGLLWTRDALRRLLLRELRRPDVNPNPPDLIQAIVDVDTLGSDIDTSMSCWRGDPEILDCLDQRIRSYLNRDQIQRMLIRHRQPTERISAVASMFSILRSLPNRDRFAEFAEEFLVVPALVKEMEIELAGRLAVVPPLLRFVTRLTVVDIDVECRGRLVGAFDNALADILEQEIWAVTGRKDVDKALALLRLWLPSPLKTGRCRDLVETALGKAIQKSEFFNTFLESYKHDKVRSKAAESLDQLLVEYGFKSAPASA